MVCNSKMLDLGTDRACLILWSYEISHFSALLKKKKPNKLSEVNAALLLLENFLNNLKIGASQRENYRS